MYTIFSPTVADNKSTFPVSGLFNNTYNRIYMEDAEILTGLICREQDALGALHRKYAKLLFARAYTMLKNPLDAEEAVQSFFVNHLLSFSKWDQVLDLKAYLLRGIYNCCLIMMEKEKRTRAKKEQFLAEELSAFGNTKEPAVSQPELECFEKEMIHQLLGSLTSQQQIAMRLAYVDGFRYRDIASIMNISVNSVKTHLRGARKSIQKYQSLFQSFLSICCIWWLTAV